MAEQGEPHPDWPDGILFKPEYDIPWQYEFMARSFLMRRVIVAADMGLGKTVIALGSAAIAFEKGLVDLVLVVCEANKLTDWKRECHKFTRLGCSVYHGPKRKDLLGDLPQVLVTTYETARSDSSVFPPKGSRSRTILPGPLAAALKGMRVMLVYDEVTKIGHGRGSKLYKAHQWLEQQLRKDCKELRVVGLTGTPMETDLDGMFNELRIVVPHAMPTVAEFERRVVSSRHPVYKTATYKQDGKEWFRSLCDPHILRKRKSDPDVRDSFPPLTEQFTRILMHDDQYRIYRMLEDLAWTPQGERKQVPGLAMLLRLLAGDPWAVLESASREDGSPLARVVAEEMGGELEKCSSAKAQELVSLADIVMSGGGKLLFFTFFAHTVMPALVRRLGDRPVFTYHGGMTTGERDKQVDGFRDYPGGAIMLASDAGSKGLNFPFVEVVGEYEPASKHSTRVQRSGRGHRFGRTAPLTFITFVLESSIENSGSMSSVLSRNADQDFMLHDDEAEGFTTAEDRRELFAQARPRKGCDAKNL